MFKKLESAISFKAKAGLVTFGIKSFMAHTPTAFKGAILAVVAIASFADAYFISNPTVLPQKAELWLIGAQGLLVVIFHAFGVKNPVDDSGSPISQPADQINSLKKK